MSATGDQSESGSAAKAAFDRVAFDRVAFELLATDGKARRGQVTTARGTFQTPVFMPVGTRGAIIHLDAADYDELGLEVVLANTYHLHARPGADVIEVLGGLHSFTGWDGHFLTDSGGFQIMSLGRRNGGAGQHRRRSGGAATPQLDDEGVTFRSTYDGMSMRITPEDAVSIQRRLGSDIQMALDVCPELPAPLQDVRAAADRTHLWAARAAAAMAEARRNGSAGGQALFGICQGGVDPALRCHSAEVIAEIGFDGYGIGGLSVGESRAEMGPALAAATEVLPSGSPRYLMGVGDPARIVDAIAAGVDMFDCVLPSRLGRHGTALTPQGRVNIRNARYARDHTPLDLGPDIGPTGPAERTRPGARFSRGYLRHLMSVNEPTAGRILTLHNIAFLVNLVADARSAIELGQFELFREQVNEVWG